jgi:hypothetical protein
MKKIMTVAVTTLLSAICFSNAFASILISGRSPNILSNPASPFEGSITFVTYYNQNNEPVVAVDLLDEKKNYMQVTFKDTDLSAGIALLNAVGKPLVIGFFDRNFTVNEVFTYDNTRYKKFDKPQS